MLEPQALDAGQVDATKASLPQSRPAEDGAMLPDEKKESPSADGILPTQGHPAMHAAYPDTMPPQQVFVNTSSMTGLTAQFQSFGMNEGQQQELQEAQEDDTHEEDGETDTDAQDSADQPLKLFVGQIPKSMNEEDIFPTFNQFGPLKDVSVIRDRHTGLHKGCAFVTYLNTADGESARDALHDNFTFEGARRPAQVKPAEPSVPENKLFIGMLSRTAGEEDVRKLFSPFGEIREIFMIRNQDGSSKCAAFLRFVKREAAVESIERLNSNIVMEGSIRPLIVKFADNKQQRQQRHIRNARRQEMIAAIAGPAYAPTGYAQIPPTLPIGMHHPGHPEAPQYPMHHQHPPPHHQHQQYGAYPTGNLPTHPHIPPHHYMYATQQFSPMHPYGYQQQQQQQPPPPQQQPQQQQQQHNRAEQQRANNPRPREGPAGANLFVYHLPHDLTDADLATAFNPFGNVISAKVYVDKFTGESKGFGFVSYDSVISAESAIEQMNGFPIGNKRLKVQHKRVHGNNAHGNNAAGNMPLAQAPLGHNPAGDMPLAQGHPNPQQHMLNPGMLQHQHPHAQQLLQQEYYAGAMPPQQQQPQAQAPHGQQSGLPQQSLPMV